jgi:MFS superfamily sulfate permease-like transporter
MDYTGVETLEGLLEDLRKRDIDVRLARVHQTVLERLRTSRTLTKLGEEHAFPTRGGRDRGRSTRDVRARCTRSG